MHPSYTIHIQNHTIILPSYHQSIFNKEVVVPPGHICCFIDQNDNHLFAKPGIHNIQDPFLKRRGSPIPLFGPTTSSSSGTSTSGGNHSYSHNNPNRNIIEHGDRCCLTVPHGMIGVASDMGRPILLPPGLHSWKSETIRFESMVRLDGYGSDDPVRVVALGPYTILTVDEGYIAITNDNGKQVLLEGGGTHLLTHSKWRFEQFICQKIQTEDLREVHVGTADNVLMQIDATVVWRIRDADKAAVMVTESPSMRNASASAIASASASARSDFSIGMGRTDLDPLGENGGSLSKLRRDVLKQTLAAIARFVSGVNYADYFHYVSSIHSSRTGAGVNVNSVIDTGAGVGAGAGVGGTSRSGASATGMNIGTGMGMRRKNEDDDDGISVSPSVAMSQITMRTVENPMFNIEGLAEAMTNAMEVMSEFGVQIMGVSVISAHPVDQTLRNSLSTSAVASAEALKVEARARGLARAVEIEAEAASITTFITAEAEAKAVLTKARADAQAEVLRSDGAKEAQILRAEGAKEASKLVGVGVSGKKVQVQGASSFESIQQANKIHLN